MSVGQCVGYTLSVRNQRKTARSGIGQTLTRVLQNAPANCVCIKLSELAYLVISVRACCVTKRLRSTEKQPLYIILLSCKLLYKFFNITSFKLATELGPVIVQRRLCVVDFRA